LGRSGRAPLIFINDATINRVPPQPAILSRREAYHGRGRITDYNIREQVLYGDFPGGLKDVATENPDVRTAMVESYVRWVEEADLDGFRIDTIKHVEDDFWSDFAPRVRERIHRQGKTNFFMFGEAFDGNDEFLATYTEPNKLDSVFYFSQHYTAFRDVFVYAHETVEGASSRQGTTQQIADLWSKRRERYGATPQPLGANVAPAKALVNFIDNHDVARFLFFARGDVAALRNALTLLFTEEGVPCVYYGTEQDLAGGNDPANREILWDTGYPVDGPTYRHIARLARIRKDSRALRRGDTTIRYATTNRLGETDAGIFAFERTGGDAETDYALVVMNVHPSKTSITERETADGPEAMAVGAAPGTTLVDVLGAVPTEVVVGSDGRVRVAVGPQSAFVFVPKP
jgi:glycosidase